MYREEILPLTPEQDSEPLPVQIYDEACPIHNFKYVSFPRQAGGESYSYVAKCCIRTCPHGLYKQ